MSEEIKEVVKEEPKKVSKKTDIKKWKNRKLMFVNEMTDKAAAQKIAARILQHK